MTKKLPVSGLQNIWFDAQQVGDIDLSLEQDYNNNVDASIINNQFGSGVIPESLNQKILFDSSKVIGILDGKKIDTQFQPSDTNYGNQLEIALIGSKVAGNKTVKVAIIGLDFNGNLQYETFTFKINENQYSKKHYTNILMLLFNDVIGPEDKSFNLGGKVIIKETEHYKLSRDPIMVAQDIEPNLFFRDFFLSANYGTNSFLKFLRASLPLYNVDNLNIYMGYRDNKFIDVNDVTTQVGEKFLATTNNIQKISLLLSVVNEDILHSTELDWHGDLVVSIYSLQTSVQSPTDIAPNTAIEFSPNNVPIAQLSFNYDTLKQTGFVLDGYPQPIDFVFSNTQTAVGSAIIPGNYYIITIKRSGSSDKCKILITAGSARTENSRVCIFNGSTWTDIPEENLWFRVWNDSVKVSDGQAYDTGHGITIPKTMLDQMSGSTVDYSFQGIQFVGGNTDIYNAVLNSNTEKTVIVQDQRTGNPVYSRKEFVPNINLLNSIDFASLSSASEPLLLGNVVDRNQKSADTTPITSKIHAFTFANDELVLKIITDSSDPKYDPSVNSLVTNLLNGDLINAKIIPDNTQPFTFYRISKAEICTMLYGDVNGDGKIDDEDLAMLNSLIGADITTSPPVYSNITTNGITTSVINGYATLTKPFVTDVGFNFQLVNLAGSVLLGNNDGYLSTIPSLPNLATFSMPTSDGYFSSIPNLDAYSLVIYNSINQENNGIFSIIGVDGYSNSISINKIIYDSELFLKILRADIDNNFKITSNDGYLLQNYIQKLPPMPPIAQPSLKIGTPFQAIKLKVEKFIDRTDGYYSTIPNRSTVLHNAPDIYYGDGYVGDGIHLTDGYLINRDFTSAYATFNIIKQLSWEDSLISISSHPKFISTALTYSSGLNDKSLPPIADIMPAMQLPGSETRELYPISTNFDPGRTDQYIPNNLIIGNSGEIRRPDGNYYKVDFEIAKLVFEIPLSMIGEKTMYLFDDFISNYFGGPGGLTRLGFPAMKFADGTFVEADALGRNQVRFLAEIQSFSPNETAISIDGYYGVVVDPRIGIYLDDNTGILKLNFANLYQDPIFQTLNTKVQIQVFLKKSGFNNAPLFLNSIVVNNLLS
jgi:hypothetical protein